MPEDMPLAYGAQPGTRAQSICVQHLGSRTPSPGAQGSRCGATSCHCVLLYLNYWPSLPPLPLLAPRSLRSTSHTQLYSRLPSPFIPVQKVSVTLHGLMVLGHGGFFTSSSSSSTQLTPFSPLPSTNPTKSISDTLTWVTGSVL